MLLTFFINSLLFLSSVSSTLHANFSQSQLSCSTPFSSLLPPYSPLLINIALTLLHQPTIATTIATTMDAVLRQSKAVCPFLKKASPATLRALSTASHSSAAAPEASSALIATSSPCGGALSKLQLLAGRCPVMSKAMAIQATRIGSSRVANVNMGYRGVAASLSASFSTSAAARTCPRASAPTPAAMRTARLHTSRSRDARAVDGHVYNDKGRLATHRRRLCPCR